MIIKNFYPDRLCLDSRLNHLNSICNACLLSFPSREICYDIFIVVVNKNLTKPGNIKTKHYSATDGSGLCLKALLIRLCTYLQRHMLFIKCRGLCDDLAWQSLTHSWPQLLWEPGILFFSRHWIFTHTHTQDI